MSHPGKKQSGESMPAARRVRLFFRLLPLSWLLVAVGVGVGIGAGVSDAGAQPVRAQLTIGISQYPSTLHPSPIPS
ncbi:MAG: hypothetical protein ACOYMG_29525, partial [Candidatus Methylumidiphilus sp.]